MSSSGDAGVGGALAPTEEQEQIIASAAQGGNLMVQAYAGTAKTTTITMLAPKVPGSVLAMAFNKSIAQELGARLPGNFLCKTANALGHGIWGRRLGMRLDVDGQKELKLLREIQKERGPKERDQSVVYAAKALLERARRGGVLPAEFGQGFQPDTEETWTELLEPGESPVLVALAREALRQSVALALKGKISFDEQIYCPVLLGGPMPKFETVVVDEAQDLSPLNHALVGLVLRQGGRVIQVGDPKQAIYGFRGADYESMRSLVQKVPGEWKQGSLTLTFRCPKMVVRRQQVHAPGFRAASGNKEGIFQVVGAAPQASMSSDSPMPLLRWGWRDLERAKALANGGSVAVLCRNNGPVIGLALAFIRQGIAPVLLGRDVLKTLVTLSKKIVPEDDVPAQVMEGLVMEWADKEVSLLLESQVGKAEMIYDRRDALVAVCESQGVATSGDVRTALEFLGQRENGQVTLSTIHKAKGLEWDVVLHLDPWRIPSKQAKRAAEAGDVGPLEQEMNLLYVCETRSKNVLLHAESRGFR